MFNLRFNLLTFSNSPNRLCRLKDSALSKNFLIILSTTLFAFLSANSLAATLPNFSAVYDVNAYGIDLGKAKQSFNCQENDCTLISRAKPSGLAALFFKDSSVETIKLTQTDDEFKWLSYHKLGLSQKDGKEIQKHTTLSLDETHQQIWQTEKKKAWPIQANIYDLLSIVYAIQYNKLNSRPLTDLYVQDSNFQDKLTLKSADEADSLDFDFSEDWVDTLRYTFDSHNAKIELWLLPNQHYFPGKIRVTHKEDDRAITLNLAELPKIL
ncbi:MAG: DUF3108 domain-containing protein [Thiomicrorhabdus sp.]|jgi:hypothetical protein|nr:DUF3108 domain-containing protein [Thiomicrorhabdus sp.]